MKRIINYLLSCIAVLVFLASSTGISFVIHHCSDNNTSEFHLFTSDYQCAHEKPETCCNQHQNPTHNSYQCSINKHHKCCSNTKGYFKVTDNYDFLRYQFKFNPELVVNLNLILPFNNTHIFNIYSFANTSPHICLSGHEVLTHISQFLI